MAGCKCTCPGCGQEIQVDENLIGMEFSCPLCSTPIRVSESIEVPEETAEDMALETGIPIANLAGEKPLRLKNKVPPVRPVYKPSPESDFHPVRPVSETVPPPPPPMPEKNNYRSLEMADRLAELMKKIAILLVVTLLVLIGGVVLICMQLQANGDQLVKLTEPSYDYQVVSVSNDVPLYDKEGRREISSVKIQEALEKYPDWELVDVIEEVETVFPNFGNREYVTGIQSNVRTWRVQLILRKRQ